MGYSKSIQTFRLVQDSLKLLAEGTPCEWIRTAPDADKFAYKLREGLHIASLLETRYPELAPYAQAHRMFTIQVMSPRIVRAVFANITDIQIEPTVTVQALTPGPSHNVSQIRSVDDLMSAWHKAMPTNDKLHFPDAQLSETDLHLAAMWAASLMPPWMLLKAGSNSLTLAPDDPRVPSAAKVSGGVKRSESADISVTPPASTVQPAPLKVSLKSKPV